jgi:hypothetical protein
MDPLLAERGSMLGEMCNEFSEQRGVGGIEAWS